MSFNKIRLLDTQDKIYFQDGIREFYHTIEGDKSINVTRKTVPNKRLKSYLVRKLILVPNLFKLKLSLMDNKTINFSALISGDFGALIPYAFFSKQNFLYMHDVWPRFHYWIFPLLDFFNVKYVFFSSKQVWMDHIRKRPNSRCKSMWLPEGINTDEYAFKPLDQKRIDVLEFGRRYEKYHLLIRDGLAAHQKQHIYRRNNAELLFKYKTELTKALSEAKIVICIPSDVTHPERAEYISSMTLRYLQAMASKCLIVGITPFDMVELFDYQAVVEIDIDNPVTQLLEILENYQTYLPLIERNYLEVKKNHQWRNRWEIIKQKITDVE